MRFEGIPFNTFHIIGKQVMPPVQLWLLTFTKSIFFTLVIKYIIP